MFKLAIRTFALMFSIAVGCKVSGDLIRGCDRVQRTLEAANDPLEGHPELVTGARPGPPPVPAKKEGLFRATTADRD